MLSEKNENQIYLKFQAKTWGRDSHGLFDYESTQIRQNLLIIPQNCKIIRKKNDVKQMPDSSELDLEDRELCKVIADGCKNFYLKISIEILFKQ
jgi:hypothetical protein